MRWQLPCRSSSCVPDRYIATICAESSLFAAGLDSPSNCGHWSWGVQATVTCAQSEAGRCDPYRYRTQECRGWCEDVRGRALADAAHLIIRLLWQDQLFPPHASAGAWLPRCAMGASATRQFLQHCDFYTYTPSIQESGTACGPRCPVPMFYPWLPLHHFPLFSTPSDSLTWPCLTRLRIPRFLFWLH